MKAVTWFLGTAGMVIFLWWLATSVDALPKWLPVLAKLPPLPSAVIWGFVALDLAWLAYKYLRNRRLGNAA